MQELFHRLLEFFLQITVANNSVVSKRKLVYIIGKYIKYTSRISCKKAKVSQSYWVSCISVLYSVKKCCIAYINLIKTFCFFKKKQVYMLTGLRSKALLIMRNVDDHLVFTSRISCKSCILRSLRMLEKLLHLTDELRICNRYCNH